MVFQFKIKIEGLSNPPVWRKVEVPASFDFLDFHDVIQTVFGWENAHLWSFEPRSMKRQRHPSLRIAEPHDCGDDDDNLLIASQTSLLKIFPSVKELIYIYDFGDNWTHSVKLEAIIDENRTHAVCTGGKGTTPPEDCGGVGGYEALKEAFEQHDEGEMKTYRDWLCLDEDELWNPDAFGAKEINDINAKLDPSWVTGSERKPIESTKPFTSKYTNHPGYYTIQELLKRFKVDELRSMATLLGLRFKSGVTKGVMLDYIANRLINNPETLIENAFYYELKAFLDIITHKMSLQYADESGILHELNRFGLIYALDYRKSKISTLNFQMDLADILEPLIPAELERRERDGSLLFEKLALGCANIYGYTEMYYLQNYFQVVGDRVGRKFDSTSLTQAFYPILSAFESGKKNEKGIMLSPFSKFVNFFPDEEHIDFDVPSKKFDFDTILKYGEMPYPRFSGREADALRETVNKYGTFGCNADEILRRMWLNHQDSDRTNPLPDISFLDLPNTSALQPCLNSIMDFQNNVPCWKLCGNSSQEIAEKEMASGSGMTPRITLGPNLRAMGFDTFGQGKYEGENLTSAPFTSSQKVGRNDPCPCGSGKKYKHCCGRNK